MESLENIQRKKSGEVQDEGSAGDNAIKYDSPRMEIMHIVNEARNIIGGLIRFEGKDLSDYRKGLLENLIAKNARLMEIIEDISNSDLKEAIEEFCELCDLMKDLPEEPERPDYGGFDPEGRDYKVMEAGYNVDVEEYNKAIRAHINKINKSGIKIDELLGAPKRSGK